MPIVAKLINYANATNANVNNANVNNTMPMMLPNAWTIKLIKQS